MKLTVMNLSKLGPAGCIVKKMFRYSISKKILVLYCVANILKVPSLFLDYRKTKLIFGCLHFSVELATLTRVDGKTQIKILNNEEVDRVIKKIKEDEAKAEKKKEADRKKDS